MSYIDFEYYKDRFPELNTEVLEFINRFVEHSKFTTENNEPWEVTRKLFRAGYCYYFANMLKTAFNRGTVCWAAPFSHIIWVDEDDFPYDIEGVYDGEATDYIPVEFAESIFPDFCLGYKHLFEELLPEEKVISKDIVLEIILKYRQLYYSNQLDLTDVKQLLGLNDAMSQTNLFN